MNNKLNKISGKFIIKNMSSAAHIFIEYKDSRGGDWNLLRAYTLLKDREIDRIKSQEELEDITVNYGGELFCKVDSIIKYGTIRDLLNDQSKKIYGRGFPKDISQDLGEILQRQQSEIDILNEKEPDYNHDWRYSKSWCYISELFEIIEESYRKALLDSIDSRFKSKLSDVDSKLTEIYNHLIPHEDQRKEGEEEVNPIEPSDDYYIEELDDLICAKGFCNYLENLTEFIIGGVFNDIRIVYYIS